MTTTRVPVEPTEATVGLDEAALRRAIASTRDQTYSALTIDEHRDLIRDAVKSYLLGLAASPPESGADGWRSMDSAPKDGSTIRVSVPASTVDVFWDADLGWVTTRPIHIESIREPSGWRSTSPLPAPPPKATP